MFQAVGKGMADMGSNEVASDAMGTAAGLMAQSGADNAIDKAGAAGAQQVALTAVQTKWAWEVTGAKAELAAATESKQQTH